MIYCSGFSIREYFRIAVAGRINKVLFGWLSFLTFYDSDMMNLYVITSTIYSRSKFFYVYRLLYSKSIIDYISDVVKVTVYMKTLEIYSESKYYKRLYKQLIQTDSSAYNTMKYGDMCLINISESCGVMRELSNEEKEFVSDAEQEIERILRSDFMDELERDCNRKQELQIKKWMKIKHLLKI